MRVNFFGKIKVVLLFVTISVIIGVSRSRKFASSKPQRTVSETCGKWDKPKPEDCYSRGMDYYLHPVKKCESLGFCDCYQGGRGDEFCESSIRLNIYMPERNRCYPVFSQGPCKRREWLIFDEKQLIGKCVRNPCYHRILGKNKGDDFWFYDPRIGRCLQALTKSYCPNNKKLTLVQDSPYPQCTGRTGSCGSAGGSIGFKTPKCLPGSRYSLLLKKCRIVLGKAANVG